MVSVNPALASAVSGTRSPDGRSMWVHSSSTISAAPFTRTRYGVAVPASSAGATTDVMNLAHALGSAHDELKPQTRADIERRANQLRSLVGSTTVDARLAGGRALQAAYAARNQNLFDNDAILRSVMISKSQENMLGRGSGGSEPAGRVASNVSVPGRAFTYAPGPLRRHSRSC